MEYNFVLYPFKFRNAKSNLGDQEIDSCVILWYSNTLCYLHTPCRTNRTQ